MRTAASTVTAPWVEWEDFRRAWRKLYRLGDHVSIIGPTGTGKTVLSHALLEPRRYVIGTGTKPKDPELTRLTRHGWAKIQTAAVPAPTAAARVLVWPKFRTDSDRPAQRAVFGSVLDTAFAEGWTLWVDEAAYLAKRLRLRDQLETIWQQGRSNRCGMMACTQRPAWVPLDMYSAAQHLFFFGTNDDQDLRRIGGLNGADSRVIRRLVAGLPRDYRFLYLDTRTGNIASARFGITE